MKEMCGVAGVMTTALPRAVRSPQRAAVRREANGRRAAGRVDGANAGFKCGRRLVRVVCVLLRLRLRFWRCSARLRDYFWAGVGLCGHGRVGEEGRHLAGHQC